MLPQDLIIHTWHLCPGQMCLFIREVVYKSELSTVPRDRCIVGGVDSWGAEEVWCGGNWAAKRDRVLWWGGRGLQSGALLVGWMPGMQGGCDVLGICNWVARGMPKGSMDLRCEELGCTKEGPRKPWCMSNWGTKEYGCSAAQYSCRSNKKIQKASGALLNQALLHWTGHNLAGTPGGHWG